MAILYTDAKVSPVGKINKADLVAWFRTVIIFTIPVGVIYLLQLQSTLQANNFLALKDLLPSQLTLGAAEGYVIGQFLGLLRKFLDGKK